MSFRYLPGTVDIAMAFAGRPGWWVLLLVGLAEIAIGFWAAVRGRCHRIAGVTGTRALWHGWATHPPSLSDRPKLPFDGRRAGASRA
jgi:hypothetical protein